MTIGFALLLAGLAQGVVGCIFFRQPGASSLLGPIWHARKYLTQTGVALWVGGSLQGLVGIVFRCSSTRSMRHDVFVTA